MQFSPLLFTLGAGKIGQTAVGAKIVSLEFLENRDVTLRTPLPAQRVTAVCCGTQGPRLHACAGGRGLAAGGQSQPRLECVSKMSDTSENNSSVEVYSVDEESDDFSCSSYSCEEDSDVDVSNEGHVIQPYQFEPELTEEEVQQRNVDADGEAGEADRQQTTDWCSCGNCSIMPDVENCKCCKEVQQFEYKWRETDFPDDMAEGCFTDHPWFEAVCLNPATLQTAYLQYRQQYGARAMEGDEARKFRHTAYRQVVRWCWGYLGRQNRVALPSCIMQKVRDAYPDTDGNYTGFKYPPLDV